LFVLFALTSPFPRWEHIVRILRVLVPALIPFCWIYFFSEPSPVVPREGYFVWTLSMLLVRYAGPSFNESRRMASASSSRAPLSSAGFRCCTGTLGFVFSPEFVRLVVDRSGRFFLALRFLSRRPRSGAICFIMFARARRVSSGPKVSAYSVASAVKLFLGFKL
jgi:hypothetical protein